MLIRFNYKPQQNDKREGFKNRRFSDDIVYGRPLTSLERNTQRGFEVGTGRQAGGGHHWECFSATKQ